MKAIFSLIILALAMTANADELQIRNVVPGVDGFVIYAHAPTLATLAVRVGDGSTTVTTEAEAAEADQNIFAVTELSGAGAWRIWLIVNDEPHEVYKAAQGYSLQADDKAENHKLLEYYALIFRGQKMVDAFKTALVTRMNEVGWNTSQKQAVVSVLKSALADTYDATLGQDRAARIKVLEGQKKTLEIKGAE